MQSVKSILKLSLLMLLLLKNNEMITISKVIIDDHYDKFSRPSELTLVKVALYINYLTLVQECIELSFDAYIQVEWVDQRIRWVDANEELDTLYGNLDFDDRKKIWIPDLYIRQLKDMRIKKVFEDINSLRIYSNSTMILSVWASIAITCNMDFKLFPLDVQKCPVDFSSFKYNRKQVQFQWRPGDAIKFPRNIKNAFRLPRFVVKFKAERDVRFIYLRREEHSAARMLITLSRELHCYFFEYYMPSTLFVIMSWGSFCVVPEVVPGRMVLLVTVLLALVTMFGTLRSKSPESLELKALEVWLLSCNMFVFLALIEYFVVLFGIRYEKYWNVPQEDVPDTPMQPYHSIPRKGEMLSDKNFPNRITPETQAQPSRFSGEGPHVLSKYKRRCWNCIQAFILYAGSERGHIDQVSLVIFPLSFLVFVIIYCTLYYNAASE